MVIHMRMDPKLIATLMLIIVISGCTGGSYTLINGGIQRTGDKLTGSYDRFSGSYTQPRRSRTARISFSASRPRKGQKAISPRRSLPPQMKLWPNSMDENGSP
mgnify:CR=1 FL=1